MGAFLAVSLWVALATVVPGLITVATLYGSVAIAQPSILAASDQGIIGLDSDLIWLAFAATLMVLTQALGILLEGLLIKMGGLGPKSVLATVPPGLSASGKRETVEIKPYEEYEGLYLLLAQLRETEDTQGHLKRAIAQYFMSNNSMVSFSAGIASTAVVVVVHGTSSPSAATLYIGGLFLCLLVSFRVAVIRFRVMTQSLWAARTKRTLELSDHEQTVERSEIGKAATGSFFERKSQDRIEGP